jgi:hypothetical protein
VAGDRHAARVARALDRLLRGGGKLTALAMRKHAFVGGEPAEIDASRPDRTLPTLLRDPRVQMLVGTVSLERTLKRGLGIETCDVAAILKSRDRHHGRSAEVVARATRGAIVVRADDEAALHALAAIEPARLILVASGTQDPVVARHTAASGAVVLRTRERGQEWIVVYRDGKVVASARAAGRRVEVRMFALALAYGLGVTLAPALPLATVRPWPDATLRAADFAPAS